MRFKHAVQDAISDHYPSIYCVGKNKCFSSVTSSFPDLWIGRLVSWTHTQWHILW